MTGAFLPAQPRRSETPEHSRSTEVLFPIRRPHWRRGGRDTWIDFSIRFKDREGRGLAETLLREMEERESRQRARRKVDRDRLSRAVEMVIANLFWEHFYRTSVGISFFRKKDAYTRQTLPAWLTPGALLTAIDQLQSLGYIRTAKGSWGLFPGSGDASHMSLEDSLWDKMHGHRISLDSLTVDPESVALIRLRDLAGRPIEVDASDHSARSSRQALARYNAFLSQHSTGLDATGKEIEQELVVDMKDRAYSDNDHRLPRRPEFFRTMMYRVFNGDWRLGGRFYGGWWQSIPRGWRARILIDDKPTVELDFTGFSVRALYHLQGLTYDGDPYLLEQFGTAGSAKAYRDHVKTITQALLNGSPEKNPERVALNLPRKLPKGLKRRNLRSWIEAKHRPIAHCFCAGMGLRLQALDATIAEIVLSQAVEDEVVVLPVHDSFIVKADNRLWLDSAMRKAYRTVIGQEPLIH